MPLTPEAASKERAVRRVRDTRTAPGGRGTRRRARLLPQTGLLGRSSRFGHGRDPVSGCQPGIVRSKGGEMHELGTSGPFQHCFLQ